MGRDGWLQGVIILASLNECMDSCVFVYQQGRSGLFRALCG